MPQIKLKMVKNSLVDLPPVVMPRGCEMRTYHPGDEQAWADIMNTGIGEGWTVERVKAELVEKPQFDPKGLFFVTIDGKPVGSACAWRVTPEETEMGTVHMVCVLPEARGKNLGYLVTLQVLHRLHETGFKKANLVTDDFRIPAIKAYLRLGFEPFYTEDIEASKEIWERVLREVGRDAEKQHRK